MRCHYYGYVSAIATAVCAAILSPHYFESLFIAITLRYDTVEACYAYVIAITVTPLRAILRALRLRHARCATMMSLILPLAFTLLPPPHYCRRYTLYIRYDSYYYDTPLRQICLPMFTMPILLITYVDDTRCYATCFLRLFGSQELLLLPRI